MFRSIKKHFARKALKDESYSFLFDDVSDEVVVLDTETTGLDPKKDEIISIGAVKIKGSKILTSEALDIYVKNHKAIDSSSIKVHRIRECDLLSARSLDEAMSELLHFIGGRAIVGYYLEFDVAIINRYIKERLGIDLPNKMVDVSSLYFDARIKSIPQGNIDLSFDKILRVCGVPQMGQHNALNDAIMTAMIYLKLTKGDINE
ncbi:MAG: 3'-5' exonuclease [Sulfuricurvum sp.]